MMRAAIIGFGTISGTHIEAINTNPGMELAAICDIKAELADRVPDGVAFYTDYKQMCREISPDVVHICLPHYLHYPVTKDVVEMGFNVFCEKPVALNLEEAQVFAALEAAHPEVRIGICLQNRMNDTTIELKKILDSGEYGRILGVRGFVPWYRDRSYYEASTWRGIMQYAGGGCMINQALHTLDLLYYLGGDIARIHAVVGQTNDLGVEVEGDVVARLEYANGARGLFFATTNNWDNESVQIRVACEKGVFQIEGEKLYRILPGGEQEMIVVAQRRDGAKFYYGSSHARLIARFYKAVETGSDDYIHVKDAVMVIRLIETIVKSSKEDKLLEV